MLSPLLFNQLPGYDPSGVSREGTIFGLPHTCEEAKVIILPVPWEVTVSYGAGTARGPEAVLAASTQLDLYDPEGIQIWKIGVAAQLISQEWLKRNDSLRAKASAYIAALEAGDVNPSSSSLWVEVIQEINQASFALNQWLESESSHWLSAGKLVGVLGGDHSSPLGLIQALANQYAQFSILHIDAHADLRIAYEGFEFSHASIMDNVLKLPQVSHLVSVGIRDVAPMEVDRINSAADRITAFYDWRIKEQLFAGQTWHSTCQTILASLSDTVYVSFDIDGLDPTLCPNTGTPVPGGLRFEEATYLLTQLARSGKRIIGFDLCEVAPGDNEWNGNVGARILYRLISAMLQSHLNQ